MFQIKVASLLKWVSFFRDVDEVLLIRLFKGTLSVNKHRAQQEAFVRFEGSTSKNAGQSKKQTNITKKIIHDVKVVVHEWLNVFFLY